MSLVVLFKVLNLIYSSHIPPVFWGYCSQHFKGAPFFDLSLDSDTVLEDSDIPAVIPPFLACGDLSGWNESEQSMMDADKSYPIEQEYVAPIAPPILPPHQAQEMENQSCKLKIF